MSETKEAGQIVCRGPRGLKSVLSTSIDTDVCRDPASFLCTSTLKVGQAGKELKVNSYLLDVSSPFFKSCFNGNYESPSAQRIDLRDLDYNAVLRIIQYMYSGTLIISDKLGFAILEAGKKFELDEVVQACLPVVKKGLSADSCLQIMTFAVDNCLLELGMACQDYIIHNFVLESGAFLELPYESLDKIIFCLMHRASNETLLKAIVRWVEHDESARSSHLFRWISQLNLESIYTNNRSLFQTAFTEGSVLRNHPGCKDLYMKICEARLLELEEMLSSQQSNTNASNGAKKIEASHSQPAIPESKIIQTGQHIITEKEESPFIGRRKRKNVAPESPESKAAKTSTYNCNKSKPFIDMKIQASGWNGNSNPVFSTPMIMNPTLNEIANPNPINGLDVGAQMFSDKTTSNDLNLESGSPKTGLTQKSILYPRFDNRKKLKYLVSYSFETKTETIRHCSIPFEVRSLSSLIYFKGKIYDIGGPMDDVRIRNLGCVDLTSTDVDVYHADQMTPSYTLNLNKSRSEIAACIDRNYLYVLGGCQIVGYALRGFEKDTNFVERYCLDDSRSRWEELNSMLSSRTAGAVAVLRNKIYAIGGIGVDNKARNGRTPSSDLSSVEVFDPDKPVMKDNWRYIAPLKVARSNTRAVVMNEEIYVVGGYCCVRDCYSRPMWTLLNSVELYNPEMDVWSACANLNQARANSTVFEDNNLIYAIGGNQGETRTMEVYDPRIDEWNLREWPEGLTRDALVTTSNPGILVDRFDNV